MSKFDYDLIVVGAGSGGTRAARISAGHGAKTAIIEGDRAGGTCVLRGCVPKKLLIYGSEFSRNVEDAIGYSWEIGHYKSNWNELITKKDKELDRLHEIYKKLILNSGCDLINGWAKFNSKHEVSVDNNGEKKLFSAKKILIAVGGKSSIPDFAGNQYMINSDQALDLKKLPESIVIYGSGYIAVEFAGIFNGFGVKTNLVFRSDYVLKGFDYDIRKKLTSQLSKNGIRIFPNTTIKNIESNNKNYEINLSLNETLNCDMVMSATGRNPNIDRLELEKLDINLGHNNKIIVNKFNQTNLDNIYAIGDVTDRINLTPVAIAEGHAFADREFGNVDRFVSYENVPSAVFSQPPVSVVGFTKAEAEQKGILVREYISEFNPLKNTISGKNEITLMKLVVDRTRKVIGAHMLGEHSPEIIQGIAIAIKAGATKEQFDATIGIHPTAAEEFVTMK